MNILYIEVFVSYTQLKPLKYFYFNLDIFVLALILDLALAELAALYFFPTTLACVSVTFPAMAN